MRLIVARCEVNHTGRLTARLPEALRLLMVKADAGPGRHPATRESSGLERAGVGDTPFDAPGNERRGGVRE
jgi:hypothetical protein